LNNFLNYYYNLDCILAKLLKEASENDPSNLVLGIVDMKAVERKAVHVLSRS
jgi:hypothetical protein